MISRTTYGANERPLKSGAAHVETPPNDEYNFFFRVDDCCRTYEPTGYNGMHHYSRDEAASVCSYINCRYSNYLWYLLIAVGAVTSWFAVGIVIMVIGIIGVCGVCQPKM
jgi:hypothetical protein